MTQHTLPRLAALALLAASLTTTTHAESIGSAASSAASAASSTAGSLSDSVQGSSRSSSGEAKVADGAYRVLEVARADKPGQLELRLHAADAKADAAGTFTLRLPEAALGPRGIVAGEVVQVRNRPYGLEFARATEDALPAPFFLALNDATLRELRSHALSL
jgi:hypothetical protein